MLCSAGLIPGILEPKSSASITIQASFPATTCVLHPVNHRSHSIHAPSWCKLQCSGRCSAGWEQLRTEPEPAAGWQLSECPLPRRLHNLPLIPNTPGMRWCPMSKYLSTTQISCPGSLRREENVSHGLGWAGDGWSLSQSLSIAPQELWLNSAPAQRAGMGCPV